MTDRFTKYTFRDNDDKAHLFASKGSAVMTRNGLVAQGIQCGDVEEIKLEPDPVLAAKLDKLAELTGGGPASLQDIADAGLLGTTSSFVAGMHEAENEFGPDHVVDPERVDEIVMTPFEMPDDFPHIKAETTWRRADIEPMEREELNAMFATVDAAPDLPPDVEKMGIVELRKFVAQLRKDGVPPLAALTSREVYTMKRAPLLDLIRQVGRDGVG